MQGTLTVDYSKAVLLKDIPLDDPALGLTHLEFRVTQGNAAGVVHTLRIPKTEVSGRAEMTRDMPAGELTVWLLESDATGGRVGEMSLSAKFTVTAKPPPPSVVRFTTVNPSGTLTLAWVPAG